MGNDIAQHASGAIAVVAILVQGHGQAIGRYHRALELTALHHQGHGRAVTLHVDKLPGLGWRCRHDYAGCHRGQHRR